MRTVPLPSLPSLPLPSRNYAAQVHQLFIGATAAPSLVSFGAAGVYTSLATLKLGTHSGHADQADVKRLNMWLTRPGKNQAPGLLPAFRDDVKKRKRGAPSPLDEATTHLLRLWDLEPLTFRFPSTVGASGGGGGDPGGGRADSCTGCRQWHTTTNRDEL